MKKFLSRKAFTLIELLVVITIIAILAGIALPVFSTVQERGQQTAALAQAKQIGLALRLYAADNDGDYPRVGSRDPNGTTPLAAGDANVFLGALVPTYVPDESIFFVNGSRWSTTRPDFDEVLDAGENHWAYVEGSRDTSNPRLPLLADGFSSTVGTYTDDDSLPGGLWKGRKAIVIRVDQSGTIENLSPDFTVLERRGTDDVDIFSSDNIGAGRTVRNPAGGGGDDD